MEEISAVIIFLIHFFPSQLLVKFCCGNSFFSLEINCKCFCHITSLEHFKIVISSY